MWPDRIDLKLCLLNAENLFLLLEHPEQVHPDTIQESDWQKLSKSVYENKPLHKLKALSQIIREIKPDLLMLCEVGGLESLQNFNQLFLESAFSPVLIEGNSDRNIDVGFLVRKGLPFYFDLYSNKNKIINSQNHKFSRDAVELRLFQKDRENPFLISILTHLKSKLDPERIDPGGFSRRQAELKALIEIYQDLHKNYPQTPLLVAGDFNGHAALQNTDEEFKLIYEETELKDVLEWQAVDLNQRSTFYNVRSGQKTEGRQIDYCFLPPALSSHLVPNSCYVYRYKDPNGVEYPPPQSLEQKMALPSDHYPLVFTLENLQCR